MVVFWSPIAETPLRALCRESPVAPLNILMALAPNGALKIPRVTCMGYRRDNAMLSNAEPCFWWVVGTSGNAGQA